MGTYEITAEDMSVLKQGTKELYSKIELLNSNMKIMDYLEGNLIDDSLSLDATSDVRRTYDCSLFVTDSTFEIARDTKIWIDRFIRPYVGVKNMRTNQVVWYLMGTYKIASTNVTYDEVTHTLQLSCNDLMCSLEEDFGGCVGEYTYKIPAGEDARESIIGLLKDAGVLNYNVGLIDEEIPYDLEFDYGTSYYDMLKEILELWIESWQMYFDINGVFVWEPLPISLEDDIVLDNGVMQQLLIREQRSDEFSGIFNKTVVYGRLLEPKYYSDTVSYASNIYSANVKIYNSIGELIDTDSYIEYQNSDEIGLKIPTTNTGEITYINIASLGNVPICNDNGEYIGANYFNTDEVWVFRYRKLNSKGFADFYCLGQYLPKGEYTEDSKDVLYSTVNTGKTLLHIVELDSIYSDDLANQRAVYETYLTCRRRDTLSLEMIAVYWMDVNQKVEYQPIGENKPSQYLVQNISYNSTDGIMNVTLQKFYDDYTVFYKKMNGQITN